MSPTPEAHAAGDPELRFAHYRVLRHPDGSTWELGRGAMGVTYKAYDEELRIDVALKVITPGQVDDPRDRRFSCARRARRRGCATQTWRAWSS